MVFHEYITRDGKGITILWYVLVSFLMEEFGLEVGTVSLCDLMLTYRSWISLALVYGMFGITTHMRKDLFISEILLIYTFYIS